jgi:hypothetical protein
MAELNVADRRGMSQTRKPNWLFLVGAAGGFVAGISNLFLHHLLFAGGFIGIGGYYLLNATGALEEKRTGKYRLAELLALLSAVLSFAGFFQWLLER